MPDYREESTIELGVWLNKITNINYTNSVATNWAPTMYQAKLWKCVYAGQDGGFGGCNVTHCTEI